MFVADGETVVTLTPAQEGALDDVDPQPYPAVVLNAGPARAARVNLPTVFWDANARTVGPVMKHNVWMRAELHSIEVHTEGTADPEGSVVTCLKGGQPVLAGDVWRQRLVDYLRPLVKAHKVCVRAHLPAFERSYRWSGEGLSRHDDRVLDGQ